jgi:hypothetical protein
MAVEEVMQCTYFCHFVKKNCEFRKLCVKKEKGKFNVTHLKLVTKLQLLRMLGKIHKYGGVTY